MSCPRCRGLGCAICRTGTAHPAMAALWVANGTRIAELALGRMEGDPMVEHYFLPERYVRIPAADATDDQIRDYVCRFYDVLGGLSASPETLEAYDAIIAPDEVEGHHSALQQAMDHMWSCALTVDGEDRILLADASPEIKARLLWLWRAYQNGAAMTDEGRTGDAFGARRTGVDKAAGLVPRRGDHVIIDARGVAHTFSMRTDLDAGGRFLTVEGGNQDARGFMAIEDGVRVMRDDGLLTNEAGTSRHEIWCWFDVVAIIRGAGVEVGIPRPERAEPAPPTESAPTG